MKNLDLILGIDTSCDDTSMSIFDRGTGKVLSNIVSSQIKIHAPFGGIVPEVASRAHLENLSLVYTQCLSDANVGEEDIRSIAVTNTPGLIGCLLTGTSFAKGLAYRLRVPLVGVNHLHGHLFSPFIHRQIAYPFLGLVVSGGHTAFYRVASPHDIQIVGQTVDDAAGEAFDKGAKLAGLSYPGGPEVDRRARLGDEDRFEFKVARVKMGEQYLSFSGLKTAAQQHLAKISTLTETDLNDYCASLQRGIVDALVAKLRYFLASDSYAKFALSGGVAMNSRLREQVTQTCEDSSVGYFMAEAAFCTDNGAMIAHVAALQNLKDELFELNVLASQKIQARQLGTS